MKALKQRCVDCRGSHYATSYSQRCHSCEVVFRNKSAAEKMAMEQQKAHMDYMAQMVPPDPMLSCNFIEGQQFMPPGWTLQYHPIHDTYGMHDPSGQCIYIMSARGAFSNGEHWRAYSTVYGSAVGQSGAANSGTYTVTTPYAHTSTVTGYSIITGGAAPREPIHHAGIRAGEIIGWRAWNVIHGKAGLRLASMYVDHIIWEPGKPMVGGSAYEKHRIYPIVVISEPEPPGDNPYGIHAYKKPLMVVDNYCNTRADVSLRPVVIGEIALWGEVVEHEKGYRGQYGKPKSFLDIRGAKTYAEGEAILEELRRDYLK